MKAEKASELCKGLSIFEIRKHFIDRRAGIHELQVELEDGTTLHLSATGLEGDDKVYIDVIKA